MHQLEHTEQTVWWHTALHIASSFIIIVPAIFVAGLLVVILDFLQEGYIGRTGEGIGFIMRGIQYALASGASIALPHLLFKKSNVLVTVTVFVTVVAIIFGSMLLLQATMLPDRLGFYGWIELVSSIVGILGGAIYYLYNRD